MNLEKVNDGWVLRIRIIPNSSRNELVQDGEIWKLKLTAQPIENKANKALVEFLSKYFKVAKSNVEIIKGHTGKDKKILIRGLE